MHNFSACSKVEPLAVNLANFMFICETLAIISDKYRLLKLKLY